MNKALKITPDQQFEIINVEGYQDLSEAVEGTLTSVPSSRDLTVYVNDEGLLYNMPQNKSIQNLTKYPYRLVGNALVMGPIDDEGNETDVTPELVKLAVDAADDSGLVTLCVETFEMYGQASNS